MRWGGDSLYVSLKKGLAKYRRYKADPEAYRAQQEDDLLVFKTILGAFIVLYVAAYVIWTVYGLFHR
jgi:hypothetical protein